MDWDDLRLVLAVARSGTLSAAARSVGLTQPTLGRRLRALEERLGVHFFDRTPGRHVLTRSGRAVLGHVEDMERAALAVERLARGRDLGIAGRVRVTSSEWVAVRVVAPSLSALHARHPELEVEIVADGRHLSLSRREADLAIRPRPFEDGDVVSRRAGRFAIGLFASARYLARKGQPDFARGCAGHDLVAMSEDVGDPARSWLARIAPLARTVARVNGREPMLATVESGLGMACLPRTLAEAARLVEVAAPVAPPAPLLFLGVHRDLRAVPRVRAVFEHLRVELGKCA